jgi:hypothetical protein
MKHLSGNGTTDTGYWEHFQVTSMYCSTYVLLYLLSNTEISGTSCDSLPSLVEGFGEDVSRSLSNDCRLSRKVQLVPQSKVIDDASLQGIYKLSHKWVTVTTAITTNNPRCVLNRILVQLSGVEALKTRHFHCSPHMLASNNVN